MELELDAEARIKILEAHCARLQHDLSTATVALTNDKFSANVYRKAIEHEVKDHVYGKILKTVGIVGTIVGFGLTYSFNATIESQIETKVRESMTQNQGAFLSAGNELTRDNLVMLISQWLPEPDSRAWVLSEVTGSRQGQLVGMLQDIIRNPSDGEEGRHELNIALQFAAENRITQLVPVLREAFENDGREPEFRILAFKGLLSSMDVGEIDTLLQDYAKNDAARDAILTERMISELARSKIDAGIVNQFFAATDTPLKEQTTLIAVNTFYFRNPAPSFANMRARYDLSGLNAGIVGLFDATTRVIGFIINPDSSSPALIAQEAKNISMRLEGSYGGEAEDVDFLNLKWYAGYGLLRLGEKEVFVNNLLNSYEAETTALEIAGDILKQKLFPRYKTFLSELRIPNQEQAALLQSHLREFISTYEWESKDKSYQYPVAISASYREDLERMKRGEQSFVNFFSYNIPPWEWAAELLPQFPDARTNIQNFNKPGTRLIGTSDQQYDFSMWLATNQFEWDENSNGFRVAKPDVVALKGMMAGNKDVYLQNMSENFFNARVWVEQVAPLFPEALQSSALLASDNLTGSEEEQSQLYQWVLYNAPFWDSSSGKYQTPTEEHVVAALKRGGGLSGYVSYMQTSYFGEEAWLQDVYPLFAEAARDVFRAATVSGTATEQDDLWQWVQLNTLVWNGSIYGLPAPQVDLEAAASNGSDSGTN